MVGKLLEFKIAGRQIHLIKLIGAFIVIGGALMLFSSVYKMLWISSIIENVNHGGVQQVTLELSGVTIIQNLEAGDTGTHMGLLLVPVAAIMFWAAVIVFGGIIYNMDRVFPLPGAMGMRPMPVRPLPVRPVIKEKKGRRR
jgi:hypothetical protein